MKYYYNTEADTINIVHPPNPIKDKKGKVIEQATYNPQETEVELTKTQFDAKGEFDTAELKPDGTFNQWAESLELKTKILLPQKKQECRELILSRYSESDQANIKARILYEREIGGAVTAETKQAGKEMFEWIRAVLTELKTKGINADFNQFKP